MIDLKRPLGFLPLIMVLLTLLILSFMLASMVQSRVALLQNGTQVVLKTAPIDPRDLLRGYYVRLSYDISRISVDTLPAPMSDEELADGFKRHSLIYVKLQPDEEGYWSPVSLHRKPPEMIGPMKAVFIRGRVQYGSCNNARRNTYVSCKINIRYGIEKFFAQKKRAKKLEDFGRQTTAEMRKVSGQIDKLQKKYRLALQQRRKNTSGLDRRNTIATIREKPEIKAMSKRLADLREKMQKLRMQNRKIMAKRFAVIARIDKKSGEAAISGLQLDGKNIYEERLF